MLRTVLVVLQIALSLAMSLTCGLSAALAESRITAMPAENADRKGMAASARLRIVVIVPSRLELDTSQGGARVSSNRGTAVAQCSDPRTQTKSPECPTSGFGTSGINIFDAPRGMTAVAQP